MVKRLFYIFFLHKFYLQEVIFMGHILQTLEYAIMAAYKVEFHIKMKNIFDWFNTFNIIWLPCSPEN